MRKISIAILAFGAGIGSALAQTVPPPSRVIVEQAEFRDAACMNKPDGQYCGLGSNSQLLYQCTDRQIVHQTPCPGGCDAATLSCKTDFGVKGIDPPKPQ